MVDEEKFKNQTESFRRTVLKELDENSLKDPVRIEFLLNQLLKDDEVILSDDAKMNLRTILSGGIKDDNKDNKIDGYKSVSEQYKENLDKILRSRLKTEVQPLGADAMTSMEALGHDVYLDLGLSDVQSKIERFEHKDKLYECIKDARIIAASNKYKGEDGKIEISGECKWYQFKRKRNIYKAIRDINPVQYWADKETDGSSILKTLGYYKVRKWNSNRPNKRYEKACRRLESIVEDRVKDSELRWFSKDFGRKLGLKAKSLWRNITFRSMDRTLKKLTKNGNVNKLCSVIEKYEKKSKDFKDDYPENGSSYTKLQRRYINTVDEIKGQIISKCKEGIENFNNQFEKAEADIQKTRSPETEKIIERYKSKLEKVASSINKSALKDFKETSAYKVYEKIKLEDFEKPSITGRDVLEQILINKGINPGSNDFNDVMNRYYPEQAKTTTNDHTQSVEQKQVETTTDGNTQSDGQKQVETLTVENSQSEGQEQVETTTDANTQNAEQKQDVEKIFELGVRGCGEHSNTSYQILDLTGNNVSNELENFHKLNYEIGKGYKRKGKDEYVNFLYDSTENKYSISTSNGEGERDATDNDYLALALVMKSKGVESVKITDLPEQDLYMAMTALNLAGINISNKEEVDQRIGEYDKRDEGKKITEEPKKEEKGAEGAKQESKGVEEVSRSVFGSNSEAEEVAKSTKTSSKGGKVKTAKEDDISLVNVTNYIRGLCISERKEMQEKGEKTVKFKDLSGAEKKLARQLHAHRMNIIKQAKAKGLSDEDIKAAATAGTVAWLKGRLSGTKSTSKLNKEINDLANANVSRAMQSNKVNIGR